MMQIAVLGTGMIGNAIVRELAQSPYIDSVVAVDAVEESLNRCLSSTNSSKVTGQVVSLSDIDSTVRILETVDLAIACLPHSLSMLATRAAIAAKCHLLDLVGSAFEEKLELHEQAVDANVLIVPGCGVAPGISNVLAGRGVELLDTVDEVVMVCGGLPRHPLPPLWYQVVFRLESLLGLCTRPALAVEDGNFVKLPPLSGLTPISFPEPVGECEAVVTDAHSIAYTLRGKVKKLYEMTARYKGHWDKMTTLAELGFLDAEKVEVNGVMVSPVELSSVVLRPKMQGASNEDVTVLRVTAQGYKDNKPVHLEWEMVDVYDKERNLTSMAKTTGFPPVIVAEWMAQGLIQDRGIVAPENLLAGELFNPFISELGKRGVHISARTH